MKSRFLLLTFISAVLTVIGWVLIVLGTLEFVLSVVAMLGGGGGASSLGLLMGAGEAIVGLFAVGAGESIGVFFAIEANTRSSSNTLKDILAAVQKTNEAERPPKTSCAYPITSESR